MRLAATLGAVALAVSASPLLVAGGATPPSACTPDLSFIAPLVEQYLALRPNLEGMGVVIATTDGQWFKQYWRGYNDSTVVPIASATKWPTSALIMTMVDEGLLSLDDTVATYLPEFGAGLLAQITLGQCLSHTSGLPGESPLISDGTITLAEAVRQIAAAGLRTDAQGQPVIPGTDFCYGGVSMHVAGRVAEVVAGVPYATLLAQRVTGPLDMGSTTFVLGTLDNPRIAGGLGSSLPDYENFTRMLLARGQHDGGSFLTALSVATIIDDRVSGAPATCIPPTADRAAYGVGCWIDIVGPGGFTHQASSPGAFGFNPWVDVRRGYHGIVMIRGQNADVDSLVEQIQAGIRSRVDALRRALGDANTDGFVNGADLSIILAQFGQTVAPGTGSDFNGDGLVDGADLSVLLSRFGQEC